MAKAAPPPPRSLYDLADRAPELFRKIGYGGYSVVCVHFAVLAMLLYMVTYPFVALYERQQASNRSRSRSARYGRASALTAPRGSYQRMCADIGLSRLEAMRAPAAAANSNSSSEAKKVADKGKASKGKKTDTDVSSINSSSSPSITISAASPTSTNATLDAQPSLVHQHSASSVSSYLSNGYSTASEESSLTSPAADAKPDPAISKKANPWIKVTRRVSRIASDKH